MGDVGDGAIETVRTSNEGGSPARVRGRTREDRR